jgi:hypothetical protein
MIASEKRLIRNYWKPGRVEYGLPLWTVCEACGLRLPGWPRTGGRISKAKGGGEVAGEVVREAEVKFRVGEGWRVETVHLASSDTNHSVVRTEPDASSASRLGRS